MKLTLKLLLPLSLFALASCTPIQRPPTAWELAAKFCDPVCTGNSIIPGHETYDYDSDRPDF